MSSNTSACPQKYNRADYDKYQNLSENEDFVHRKQNQWEAENIKLQLPHDRSHFAIKEKTGEELLKAPVAPSGA